MDLAHRPDRRLIERHRRLVLVAHELATFLFVIACLTAGCWSLTESGQLALASALGGL
ncbi:MAG: hypothetical protein II007_13555 [Gammaproteobacteria bacterium]|nr:hypothetical protein [Gammaproteobacteria bacterium]